MNKAKLGNQNMEVDQRLYMHVITTTSLYDRQTKITCGGNFLKTLSSSDVGLNANLVLYHQNAKMTRSTCDIAS